MSTHATVEIWENGGAPKSEERPVVLFKYCDGDMLINDVIEAMKRGKSRWHTGVVYGLFTINPLQVVE